MRDPTKPKPNKTTTNKKKHIEITSASNIYLGYVKLDVWKRLGKITVRGKM